MEDDELLAIIASERRQSIGFDHDDELASAREKALNYFKGEMPDVPTLPNRSKAVSTDIAEAVETVLPDLIEIFTGGDDVATFQPVGEEDEEAAQQETDYILHVVFQQNPGFLAFYSAFKDAAIEKTGIFKFWWEADNEAKVETFHDKSPEEINVIAMSAQESGAQLAMDDYGTLTVTHTEPRGKVCLSTVAPEDFTVGRDTIRLADATYCGQRSRPRIQDLIVEGYDRTALEALPSYNNSGDEAVRLARDTAGEHESSVNANSIGDLRQVEVVEHYIRIANAQGEIELWKVLTGANETVLVDKEKVEVLPFAAITPYLTPHRFYGRSIADLLIEVQRIKTALTRMALDSGYFALNQRHEVAMEKANAFTITDLLRNEPGVPVRSRSGDAVKAISSAGLDFDAFGALEYFSTVGEARTGIVRNAQGLNPDTLHDTAKGAMALMTAAQKRVRLIARIFAETGVKDLFLGVHALIRKNPTKIGKVRLRNKWVDVDPTQWGERNDMTIEIGLASGGRDHDLMATNTLLQTMETVVTLQGGVNGPFANADNIHKALSRLPRALGLKGEYFMDPKDAQPQQPKPDPAMAEAQGKLQLEQAKAQGHLQLEDAKWQAQSQMQQQQAAADAEIAMQRMQLEGDLKREQLAAELGLKREQLQAELALKRELAYAELDLKREQITMGAMTDMHGINVDAEVASSVHTGGEPG